jgi:hypothetical protein
MNGQTRMTANGNSIDVISDEEPDEGEYQEDDSEAEQRNRTQPFPLPTYISRRLYATIPINERQRALWQNFKLQTWWS